MSRALTIADRLAKYSAPAADGCIEWTGTRTYDGYGLIKIKIGARHYGRGAHRIAYIEAHGTIPQGMHVHHCCYNRACINPAHLELRTLRRNIMDQGSQSLARLNTAKTHCPRGHPYDDENTGTSNYGGARRRRCRACGREYARVAARRHRERLCPKAGTCIAAHCIHCGRMCHSHPNEIPECAPTKCVVRDRQSPAASEATQ